MTEIQEIPVDLPEAPTEETIEIKNITEDIQETPEPETPAPKKKGRGRPAGAKNLPKPKPKARIPEPEPEPEPEPIRRQVSQSYHSPPPMDPTVQLLGLLKTHMDQRTAMKRQKYAGWVGRF